MDYSEFRQMAVDLVLDFGNDRPMTLSRWTGGAYDHVHDREVEGTWTPHEIRGVLVPIEAEELPPDDLTMNDKVKVVIPHDRTPIVPQQGDHLRIPGEAAPYVVLDPKSVRPDGDFIVHTVLCKRISRR